MHRTHALVWALGLALVSGCGGGGGSSGTTSPPPSNNPPPSSTSNAITVADNTFTPSATTLAVGTTATWTWTGSAPHNVTFDDGTKSATQTTGTYARTFNAAGTYNYHCTVHGAAMSGVVTIK